MKFHPSFGKNQRKGMYLALSFLRFYTYEIPAKKGLEEERWEQEKNLGFQKILK